MKETRRRNRSRTVKEDKVDIDVVDDNDDDDNKEGDDDDEKEYFKKNRKS